MMTTTDMTLQVSSSRLLWEMLLVNHSFTLAQIVPESKHTKPVIYDMHTQPPCTQPPTSTVESVQVLSLIHISEPTRPY